MIRLRLLGGFALTGTDGPPLPTRKAEALCAYLAVSAGQAQRRDKLAALLWPDRGDAQARHSLAQTLYVIRRSFGESGRAALVSDSRTVMLDPTLAEIDTARLDSLATSEGTAPQEIASLYGGALLEGVQFVSEPFEDWLSSERQRLHSVAVTGFSRLLEWQRDTNDLDGAIGTAQRLLQLDGLQEPVHRTLMQLFAKSGRYDAMIQQYQACGTLLHRELDVTPEKETRDLYDALLAARAGTGQAPAEASATTFRRIALDDTALPDRLRWVQLPYVSMSWGADEGSVMETASGTWTKTLKTLSAFVIRKHAAFKAANTDYTRVVVSPPSQLWPNCSAVPGRVSHPGLY
ncbi:MAG: BTAD domain-containing putative transcriptional regulator [Rhodospirillaceae bacterium]|nr:BTAD domain-containing putative transcriptional regulator [Rhodospirillaceae bacterium]MDD9926538.1 BTAD domain-containing putative transcriptional regulator [Rhodospirillaceae bacterium]